MARMTDEPDEQDADGSAKDEVAKIVAAFRELPVGEHIMIQWVMGPVQCNRKRSSCTTTAVYG